MQEKRKKFDMNAPEAKALMDDLVHGTFMKEGTMVAFPTCFPGASIPIPPDESRITALDATPDGIVYGGTSGFRSHIFVGMFHGVTGVVFDLKSVDGATECTAVCCGRKKLLACVNGPKGGGRLLAADLQPLPYDLIQEWGFERPAFTELGEAVSGEPIVHAITTAEGDMVVGITSGHLFAVDMGSLKLSVAGEVPGTGRIAVGSRGNVVGQDGSGHLWSFNSKARALRRKAFTLPEGGSWGNEGLTWSRPGINGLIYAADGAGRIYSFDEERGFSGPLGQTGLSPAGPMAVTHDGRLFGFCGPELAKMFCYDPATRTVADLGVAVSVLERRRYGYVFGDAVTGRDGEIYFGENDNLGHLWIYFPKISGSQWRPR
jgi:hypothetical protein